MIMCMLLQTDEVNWLELSLAACLAATGGELSELTSVHYLKNVMSSSLIERECEPLQIDHFSAL